MFINKIYDILFESDENIGWIMLLWFFTGLIPAFFFLKIKLSLLWIPLIFIFLLGEWAFIDYIRQTKNKQTKGDIIAIKIGYILGTFPFVFIPLDIYIFRNEIFISWNWILILQWMFWILTGIFFVTIYFIVNINYAEKKNKIKTR